MKDFTAAAILLTPFVIFLVKFIVGRLRKSRHGPLPPGPAPLPIIGNLLDMPKGYEGPHWAKHKTLYGPISSITIFGQTIIIVNEKSIVSELFEKRSTIYSDRPKFVFGGEMCGLDSGLVFLQLGDRMRDTRKMMHRSIGSRTAIRRFEPLEELEARRFLLRTLYNPEGTVENVRKMTGAIILKIAYGYTVEPHGPDPLVERIETLLRRLAESTQPGERIVDVLPFLKYLPEWLPGTGFIQTAREHKAFNMEFLDAAYNFVKRNVAAGTHSPSFVGDSLETGVNGYEEDILKWAAAFMYGGGSDTSVSVLETFLLAMMIYPDVLKKAQAEIDAVVGCDRFPTFADRPNLPYTNAIVKESTRWGVAIPLGIPHASAKDDVYEGYFIPQGSIVIPNIWGFTHDPENYHDPFVFKPERFLHGEGCTPEIDPYECIFGFGRRICPGIALADASLYITIALCIAASDIRKANDERGQTIEPVYEYIPGTISHPKAVKCTLIPRSAKTAALIETVQDEHPFEPGNSDELQWRCVSLVTPTQGGFGDPIARAAH